MAGSGKNKKMKVLMVSRDRTIFDKDSETRRRMIEYGHLASELHIVVLSQKPKGKKQGSNFGFENKKFNNVFLYPTNSVNRWFYIFDAYRIAKRIIGCYPSASRGYLVSCQDPFEAGLAGWLIKRKFGLALELQVHTDFLSPHFRRESFLNKIRVLLAEFLLPRASCVRVVSERIRDSLKVGGGRALKTDPFVLPIFVDVDTIKKASIKVNLRQKYPQFDFIVLMAGRLSREKNIGLAVRAMAEIVKIHPKVGLIIVGNGPEKSKLKLQVLNRKLGDNVIFEEAVPFEILISYYKSADLFLLTSNYEGYGRTIVEAAVAGCKILSTEVGVAREILPMESIFEPGNRKALEEKIVKALEGEIGSVRQFSFPTKAQYLEKYKAGWLACLGS
jgi:glycosyltransferase involved in cell wall biosynthesis